MALLNFPEPPLTPGQTYAAPNGVTYIWDDTVGTGVWLKSTPSSPLTVTSGSIAGTPAVGQVLTYTPGTASGGTAPYTYAQQWYANGTAILGATGTSYTVLAGDAGKAITVTITANDSAAGTATATTSPVNIPGPLSIASAGTISGTATAGSTLTYSVGSASGGTSPYTYTWEWKKESDNSVLQTGGTTYLIPGSLIGGRVYVTLTATDSVAATASGNTAAYPASPATITGSPFLSVFSPSGAPNASPASVSISGEGLYGTASCANWIDGSTSLTSTGGIQFRVGAGAYGTGPTAVANGNTVDVIWNPATIAAAADGATLTGTLTDGTYTNTYTITIDRAVATLSFGALTGQATSTPVTSSTQIPSGFNVPVSMSFAGTATNPLTTPLVAVNGGAFSASPQSVNPGNTLQLKGTTGATNSTTYGLDFSIGSSAALTGSWTATTAAATASITTPSILTPANNSTGVGTFAGVTITGSTYTPLNGAGTTQTSSTWEITTGSAGGTPITGSPFTVTTSPRTSLTVAKPPLASNTTYFVRVQYATTNATAATSSFSAWSQFTTGSLFTTKTWTSNTVSAKMGFRSAITSGDWIILNTGGTAAQYATSSPQSIPSYSNAAQGAVGLNWLTTIGSTTLFAVGAGGYIGKTPTSQFTVANNPFTAVTSGTTNNLNYISNTLIVGNSGTILTSADSGSTWTSRTSGTTNNLLACMEKTNDIGAGTPISIAVGAGGVIRTSTDNITWTTRTSGTTQDLHGVWTTQSGAGAPTSARYVAVGANGTILTSPDGTTWTSRTSGTTVILRDCVYSDGLWYVVGDGGTILYSETGVTWTAAVSNTTSNLTSVTKNSGTIYAYGTTGSTFGF